MAVKVNSSRHITGLQTINKQMPGVSSTWQYTCFKVCLPAAKQAVGITFIPNQVHHWGEGKGAEGEEGEGAEWEQIQGGRGTGESRDQPSSGIYQTTN